MRGNARRCAEIGEMSESLHKVGAISDEQLQKTTLRMLGKDALPKGERMSPSQIVALRERTGVSQAVMAAFLNVAVSTINQSERGLQHPNGEALKLLTVGKQD